VSQGASSICTPLPIKLLKQLGCIKMRAALAHQFSFQRTAGPGKRVKPHASAPRFCTLQCAPSMRLAAMFLVDCLLKVVPDPYRALFEPDLLMVCVLMMDSMEFVHLLSPIHTTAWVEHRGWHKHAKHGDEGRGCLERNIFVYRMPP